MFSRLDERGYSYDDSADGWEERRRPAPVSRQTSQPLPSFQDYPDRYERYGGGGGGAEGDHPYDPREPYNDHRSRKFQDDFQTLRQRYDEEY